MRTDTTYETSSPFQVMADVVRFHATAEDTGGSFLVMQVDVAPWGGPPPLHTHEAAEFFWTLSGTLSYFRQEDDGTVTEVTGGPGSWAFVPGGVPHTYRNLTDEPGAYLAVLSPPAAMQAFLLASGREVGDTPADPAEVMELARAYGMELLDVVPGTGA